MAEANEIGHAGHRRDIQGLRAVAVLLVALNHAGVPHLGGGFVGVDVFFVLSGFLITGWLVRRTAKAGRVPFGDFYAARARRILPAATLTLVATCAASWYFLNYVRALSALHDAAWAAIFAANIHFAQVGTDYFARANPPSPIQHYWTLAVEEQFYVVWPALLAVLLVVVQGLRRNGRRSRVDATVLRRLIVLVGVGVIVSFLWSVRDTPREPTAAYFSTLTRGWELGTGALIALSAEHLRRIPAFGRACMTWLGLIAIIVAAVTFSSGTPFPGDAALLPVIGAGFVIVGGLDNQPVWADGLLKLPPMRLIGDVSYSFYLWHWPVLIIAMEYEGHPLSVPTNLALLAGAFTISVITYYLYENPLRYADQLSTALPALALWPISVAAVVLVSSIGVASIQQHLADAESATPFFATTLPAGTTSTHKVGPRKTASKKTPRRHETPYAEAVAASVTAKRARIPVPDSLSPPIQDLSDDFYNLQGCEVGVGDAASGPICHLGDSTATRTLVLFGDSHAQMWMAGLTALATKTRWAIVPLVKEGCTAGGWFQNGHGDSCGNWDEWALQQVRQIHPQAIVIGES